MGCKRESKRLQYNDIERLQCDVQEGQRLVGHLTELLKKASRGEIVEAQVGHDFRVGAPGIYVPVSKASTERAIGEALYDAKVSYQLQLRGFMSLLRAEEKALWA